MKDLNELNEVYKKNEEKFIEEMHDHEENEEKFMNQVLIFLYNQFYHMIFLYLEHYFEARNHEFREKSERK